MKFPVRISSLAYVPGYVFFVQDAVLFARPFDEQRLEFSGEPTRIVEGVPVMGPGRAPFSVSAAGVLAYWPYPVGTPAALHWFDRNGRASVAVDSSGAVRRLHALTRCPSGGVFPRRHERRRRCLGPGSRQRPAKPD